MAIDNVTMKVGAGVVVPASGFKTMFVDTDGTTKIIDSTGTKTALGGTAMEDVVSTSGGDIQDLTVSGLAGDADGDYQFHIDIIYKGGLGVVSYYLRPFGTDETQLSAWGRYDNGSGANVELTLQGNWPLFSENNAADKHIIFDGFMTSKTGQIRSCTYMGGLTSVGGQVKAATVTAWALDTATAITALTVHASVAGSIRAGSFIKLRKLKNTL